MFRVIMLPVVRSEAAQLQPGCRTHSDDQKLSRRAPLADLRLPEKGGGLRPERGDRGEQFFYKTRKKGAGPFKKEMRELPKAVRAALGGELEAQSTLLFRKLDVGGTLATVNRFVPPADVPLKPPAGLV